MKTFMLLLTIISILVTSAFPNTIDNNGKVFADCKDLKNANVYCHEQYNTRSNNATMSRQTEQANPQPCNDVICSLGSVNPLEPGIDTITNPLGDIIE
jgi:hypothetical protein